MSVKIIELPTRDHMFILALEYDPPVISKRTGDAVMVEKLIMTSYQEPKDERQVKYNRVMLEKAEAVRQVREKQIEEGKISVYMIERKDDFVAFYRQMAIKKSGKCNYTASFKVFEAFVGGKCAFKDIGHDLFVRYRDYLAGLPINPVSGKPMKYLTAWGSFNQFRYMLTEAYNEGLVDKDYRDCDEILHEKPSEQRYIVSDEDIRKLMKTPCQREDVPRICKLMLYTGLRYREIVDMKWEDITETADGRKCIARVMQLSGRQSNLYINPEAFNLLGKQKKRGYVFERMNSSSYRHESMRKWTKDAGIKDKVSFESFRRYVSTLPEDTGDIPE